jgi:hypothetical protein
MNLRIALLIPVRISSSQGCRVHNPRRVKTQPPVILREHERRRTESDSKSLSRSEAEGIPTVLEVTMPYQGILPETFA